MTQKKKGSVKICNFDVPQLYYTTQISFYKTGKFPKKEPQNSRHEIIYGIFLLIVQIRE